MSKLILQSQPDSLVPLVSVEFKMPGDLTPADLAELAKLGLQAADGLAAAPEMTWTTNAMQIAFLGKEINIPAPASTTQQRVCVVRRLDPKANGYLILDIVSGSLEIEASGLPQDLLDVLDAVWPAAARTRFGGVERLVVAAAGLQIETLNAGGRRRFQLVEGTTIEPPDGGEVRIAWEQLAWRDASQELATPKDPADRLKEVLDESDKRLEHGRSRPVSRIRRFDSRGEIEGAVFIQIRRKKTSGAQAKNEVRELVAPPWALTLGGADWVPASLVIDGDVLEAARMYYTDGADAFDEPGQSSEPELQTSLAWSWNTTEVNPIKPTLVGLASDSIRPLISTGEVLGGGANLPFLWQLGNLIVGSDKTKSENGVWIRYQLERLPALDSAVSRKSEVDAGLSRLIRIPELADGNGRVEPWQLDLGLLPDAEPGVEGARIWLDLQPVDQNNDRKVTLTLAGARIRAAAPAMHVLRTPLADPAAMPNRANRLVDLHPEARILLSNDRVTPSATATSVHALRASRTGPTGPIQLTPWQNARDVAVAYVPGPVAGLDLVPRTGGNLAPAASTNPNDPPPPDRVRDYEAGRVAVHLIGDVQISSEEPMGTVRVSTISDKDLFVPASETVAALLPWAMSSVEQNQFVGHALQPYHRNLLLEAFEWSRSAPDRQDAEPGTLPPLVDPREFEKDSLRDFRREEALAVQEKAVRDLFAKATVKPLSSASLDFQRVANWLPSVDFKSSQGMPLSPELGLGTGQSTPAFEFKWNGTNEPSQQLGLAGNHEDFDWLGAWLRWTDDDVSKMPALQVHLDGREGARRARNSDVPLLEQRTPITAVTAGWLAGRMWVIFAISSPDRKTELFTWEPMLPGNSPKALSIVGLDTTKPIDFLRIDATVGPANNSLMLVVVQGASFSVIRFKEGAPGSFGPPIGTQPVQIKSLLDLDPTIAKISSVSLAARRLFVGTQTGAKHLFVFEVDENSPPSIILELNSEPVLAMDVRMPSDLQGLSVAVATDSGNVKLFHWDTPPNAGTAPTNTVELKGDLTSGESITAVAIQPVGQVAGIDRVFVYTAVKNNTSGRIITWNLVPVSSATPVDPVAAGNEAAGDMDLRRLSVPIDLLLTDPIFNDNASPTNAPESQWLAAISAADDDGKSSLITWPVARWLPKLTLDASNVDSARPQLRTPVRFGDHEGQITSAVLVPGRSVVDPPNPPSSAPEARFGAWLVTGGVDGTVRVWDPKTGQERFRHTETPTGFWLDTLGVVRPKLVPEHVPGEKAQGFWVEAISVPDTGGANRSIMLMLSTLGDPIELFVGSNLDGTDSSLRFVCQNLPLQPAGGTNTWQPVPWSGNTVTNYRIRHGVYGCCGKDSGVPRLLGVPFEVTKLVEVQFDPALTIDSVQAGQVLVPQKLVFDAILSNPVALPPDGTTTPLVDRSSDEKIQVVVERDTSGNIEVTLGAKSRFDWRFPLTDQLPKGGASTLPGRLARLEGGVSLANDQLTLKPDSEHPDQPATGSAMKLSRAEALGRLRKIIRVPELVSDPDPKVRFREKQSADHRLEQLGNPLPHPDGTQDPIVATVIGSDASGEAVVLIAAQAADVNNRGSAILADLHTGRRLASYADGLRRAKLVVDGKENIRRLTAIGVAEDGTVRIRQLCELQLGTDNITVTATLIEPKDQERVRFSLPSPAEDVQVFDAPEPSPRRLLLARCRDGSAWLFDAVHGSLLYNMSLPDTAVTMVAFGPPMPNINNEDTDFDAWRAFFGSVSPELISGVSFAVAAIGGADGSIRVYAVTETEPPRLLRALFDLHDPIQSLSIEIDQKSREASPGGFSNVVGLVLLACDGAGPVQLIEILSGKSLINHGNSSLPPALGKASQALQGLVVFSGVLRVILQFVSGDKNPVHAWTKKTPANPSDVDNTFEDEDTIDSGLDREVLLVRCQGPTASFAMGLDASGWRLYDLDVTSFKQRTSAGNTMFDDPVLDVANAPAFTKQRYIVAVRKNGTLGIWTNDIDSPAIWNRVFHDKFNLPMRIDAATLGRVVVPMVACRGPAGRLGSAWATDLGSDELAWPDPLGPVDDDTPVAMSSWQGVPHLAVARSSDVTVWNLATGLLVHRIGLDHESSMIDLAEDLGRLVLLVNPNEPAVDRRIMFITKKNGSTSVLDTSLSSASIAVQSTRLFAFPKGLCVVTMEKVSGGSEMSVAISALGTASTAPSHARKVALNPDAIEILDAIMNDDLVWVLVRHKTGNASALLHVMKVPSTGTSSDGLYPLDSSAAAGGFDIDFDTNTPAVWTVDAEWKIRNWRFSDTATVSENTAMAIAESGRRPSTPSDRKPVSLTAVRYDGRTRLVGAAEDSLAIWDVQEKNLVRTERLFRAVPRVMQMSMAAVVQADSRAGCLRFWDQPTGRLRQRIFTRAAGLTEPGQLVSISEPARSRLIVAGPNRMIVIDVVSASVIGVDLGFAISSLTATLADNEIVIAGVEVGNHLGVMVWRTALGEQSSLHSVNLSLSSKAVALLRHKGRTLLASAPSSGRELTVSELTNGGAISVIATQDPLPVSSDIKAIRLSPALGEDCVLAAVAYNTGTGDVDLFDLPLSTPGSGNNRPYTFWSTKVDVQVSDQTLDVSCDADGPRVVAGLHALRVSSLLRLAGQEPPLFDLPIQLLGTEEAFLTGRISPSRRLDLEMKLNADKLGLPGGLETLTARAALIQSSYSCFLVDAIEQDKFRLSGALVLWDDLTASSDGLQGVLILEDVRPTDPTNPSDNGLGASASISLPTGPTTDISTKLGGPRSRLRAIPFDTESQALDDLTWSEAISWYLAGEAAGVRTEWHVSDVLFDVTKSDGQSVDGQTVVVRGVLSAADLSELQGDFLVTLKRQIENGEEQYTLSVNRAAYAAQILDQPDPAEFGTTRDDVVYPAVPGGSVGHAFDLVQPRRQPGTNDLLTNAIEKFSLATLLVEGGKVVLASISSDAFPLDLDAGSNVTQRLPLQPVDVPQLVHREAHGARIRGRWPTEFEIVSTPDTTGQAKELRASEKDKVWLLAPLARTPRGVAALTRDLLARSAGRALDWTRLQTEGVLAVHRDGGALLSATGSTATPDLPTVLNLLTGTVLRSSGTAGSQAVSLFDDARVQAHALRTGFAGVLVVRTSDARGRVTYRFVNSPYHTLVPLATKHREDESDRTSDLGSEDIDPRLLTPNTASRLSTCRTPRFQPTYSAGDQADLRGFRRPDAPEQDRLNNGEVPAIHIAEIPALRASEQPHAPLAARPPVFAGASPFLPTSFKLGYFLDKPGAVFHQVVQSMGTSDSKPPVLQAGLPTTFARREPQRFAPPSRAAMTLKDPRVVRKKDTGTLQVTVPWTEISGSVPLDTTQFRGSIEIVADPNVLTDFKLKDVEGQSVLQWIVRLGERIEAPAPGAQTLSIPFAPFRSGESVDAFDLLLVTRIELDDATRTLPNSATLVVPILVAEDENGQIKGFRKLNTVFEIISNVGGGFKLWHLLRNKDEQRNVLKPPEFLTWLNDLVKRGLVKHDLDNIYLNLIWMPTGFVEADYSKAPKVYTSGTVKLRDVPYQPQSPRLAAVLRLPVEAGSGLLGTNRREFTLFDGPAASSKGVDPEFGQSNQGDNRGVLHFKAHDAETITIADPFKGALASAPKGEVFIVKVFEDGATLLSEGSVSISES